MVLPREEGTSKLLSILGCFAFVLLLLSSLVVAAVPAAAAPQGVTLTFTSSTHTTHPVEELFINATASAPITGPVKLRWTINGTGPYTWDGQMTNGFFQRSWGCSSVGNWTLWVVWEGNEQFSSSESNHVSILVEPAVAEQSDSTLLFIAGIVVLVAIVGGLAYLSLKRKKD